MPRDTRQPPGRRLWCPTCDTDRHLLRDSVTTLNAQQETLAAAITCTRCRRSRVLATTAAFVAALPEPNEDDSDVMHRDAAYVHCQEPMTPADPKLRGMQWPVSTQAGPTEFLGVYLRTRVLRCRCGFQMEIPLMTSNLRFGSEVNHEHGDIVTNSVSPHQAARPAAAGETPSLNELDLSPQGLADAPASEVDPDSLAYPGNS